MRSITIWSEGVRLSGNLHVPDDISDGEKRPAILLCHGWGGPKEHLNSTYAPFFAKAGFIAMTFDYRGWFESDARVVTTEAQSGFDESGKATVEVQAVKDVVDPFDQIMDIASCLDYLVGEPNVDTARIGIWGTSYGGGHAVYTAATDRRIKCMVSQVGPVGALEFDLGSEEAALLQERATDKARGVDPIMPPSEGAHETLVGHPDWAKMPRYNPIQQGHRITAPSLFLDQADEELMDPDTQYPELMKIMSPDVPKDHHRFPGTHYKIYDENYQEGVTLARDWFVKYLKP